MCNNIEELKTLLSEILVLDGNTGLTATGWHGEKQYRDNQDENLINYITTKNGYVVGSVKIREANRGFGFRGDRQVGPTAPQLRGALVTAFSVAQTEAIKQVLTAYSCIFEKLLTNCFKVETFDITLVGDTEPSIYITLTNGIVEITLDVCPNDLNTTKLLNLPIPFILGSRFSEILKGKTDLGRCDDGITALIDGKWERITGLSNYKEYADSSCKFEYSDTAEIDLAKVVSLIPENRRELCTTIISEVVRNLTAVHAEPVKVVRVANRVNTYMTPSVVVTLAAPEKKETFGMEFFIG